jgi:hypothetical protein
MGKRRGNWMAVVQKFDLYIKPAKLIKGQGLCKMVTKAQDLINEYPERENELALWCSEVLYIPPGKESWYGKLIYLLHHGNFQKHLSSKERRALRLKSVQYRLVNSVIFCINYD